MSESLRFLFLEDSYEDTLLAVKELRRAGFIFEWERVDTEAAFRDRLETQPDLILADYALPQFDGLRALRIVRERGLDTPFILISGSIGEDQAVAVLQQGADDYLLKDRLARLASAIQRALERKRVRDEKRRAEQELLESEKRFRALIENSSDVITLLDADGRIIYTSPSLGRVLGYALEDYVGRWLSDFVHPRDVDAITQALVRHPPIQQATHTLVIRLHHQNGSWRWLEAVVLNLLDEPGVQAFVVDLRDITERKERERELEVIATVSEALRAATTRQEMLPIIVDQTHDLLAVDGIALAMRDPQTQETLVALARGAWADRAGTRSPAGSGVSGRVIETGQRYLNNDAPNDPRLLWRDADHPFQAVACVPLSTERHTIGALLIGRQRSGAFFTDHDVHLLSSISEIAANALYRAAVLETLEDRIAERTRELSEANERLLELDRLKSQFVSDVSHELRTPVTNLKLYVELLEVGKPEKFTSYLAILKQQAKRLTDLVESILDLSRLERRTDPIAFTALDLNSIVEQVVMAHLPRASAANVPLIYEPGPDLPPVQGAANQLIQVTTNLVANALNYTVDGQVTISTWHQNNRVCLEVSDTGIGIPPDDLPHLFERFYRGQNVSRSAIPGSGLGLAIIKEIVDAHHGSIEVESQLGAGTSFRVWLPMAVANQPPRPADIADGT